MEKQSLSLEDDYKTYNNNSRRAEDDINNIKNATFKQNNFFTNEIGNAEKNFSEIK